MRIVSKYKDYYDSMAHVYGGGDPKIVYERKDLISLQSGQVVRNNLTIEMLRGDWIVKTENDRDIGSSGLKHVWGYRYGEAWFKSKWLVIAGKLYDLVQRFDAIKYPNDPWRVFDPLGEHADLINHICKPWWERRRRQKFNIASWAPTRDRNEQIRLIDLSRRVGQPVFIIEEEKFNSKTHRYTITINGGYQTLASLGIPNFYPAEQIYQDLAYFIANKMKDSPDTQPLGRPPQTDQEKIISHGMDPKQSFRHRK